MQLCALWETHPLPMPLIIQAQRWSFDDVSYNYNECQMMKQYWEGELVDVSYVDNQNIIGFIKDAHFCHQL